MSFYPGPKLVLATLVVEIYRLKIYKGCKNNEILVINITAVNISSKQVQLLFTKFCSWSEFTN